MIVTVFRSRLMPGLQDEYVALVEEVRKEVETMPGYISHKGFFAEDGERVTIVEFKDKEAQRAWRMNAKHIEASGSAGRSTTRPTTSRSATCCTTPISSGTSRNSGFCRGLDRRRLSRHDQSPKELSRWKSSPNWKASRRR